MRGRKRRRVSNPVVGLLAVGLVLLGFYYAFNKTLPGPWGAGYQVKAVFPDAQNLLPKSPVRIAGINVGEVTEIEALGPSEHGPGAALVTMEIREEGRPVHADARLKLRARLFLGGNLFIELHPGSPSAPEMPDGATFDVGHTAGSVQLDQILTTLQADVRGNTQLLLHELGTALQGQGAAGLRSLFAESLPALRYGSQVNEALLGTEPHDLSLLVRDLGRVAAALNRYPPQLAGLIRNLRTVTGAFADQDAALGEAVAELPRLIAAARPALAALNASLPQARALAREALPGVRAAAPALAAARPLVSQLAALLAPAEAGGLARALAAAAPPLARVSRDLRPFAEEARAAASCFNEVVIPWSQMEVPDPYEPAPGPIHKELGWALPGIGGISRSADANGQYARAGPSGGNNTVTFPPMGGRDTIAGVTPYAIEGSLPGIDSSRQTRYRPDVPCENQELPDLESPLGPAPQQRMARGALRSGVGATLRGLSREYAREVMREALAPRDVPARVRDRRLRALGERLRALRAEYLEVLGPLGLDTFRRRGP